MWTHIKETSRSALLALCEGNLPLTGKFPAQKASNATNPSVWWGHHVPDILQITPPKPFFWAEVWFAFHKNVCQTANCYWSWLRTRKTLIHCLISWWPRLRCVCVIRPYCVNIVRSGHNGRHIADYIFKYIFLNEYISVSSEMSLKFVSCGLVDIMSPLANSKRPLSQPMLTPGLLTHTHIYI